MVAIPRRVNNCFCILGVHICIFRFHKSDDPEVCLFCNAKIIVPEIPQVDGGVSAALGMVDVGYRFNIFFLAGFYLSVIQIVVALMTQIVQGYDISRLL